MSLHDHWLAALERKHGDVLRGITPPDNPWQAALDDLNAIEEQAQRMLAELPKPFDGNDRRGK